METELIKKNLSDIIGIENFPGSGSKGLFPINSEE